MPRICQIQQLGLTPYQHAWSYQETLCDEIDRGLRPATLLLLEHPHTFTFGRGGQKKNLLWGEAELQRRGISVFWVDRGGDVTYHGPGQLVGYPLLQLEKIELGEHPPVRNGSSALPIRPVDYIRMLEKTLILALAVFDIEARTIAGKTGVWCINQRGTAKIGAIGVKVDARGLTRHGFALNVDPDMEYWDGIVSCGLNGAHTTSLAELLDRPPVMQQVIDAVVDMFGQVFDFEMVTGPVKTE